MTAPDSASEALRALLKTLETNDARAQQVRERARQMESLREQGYTWTQIVSTEERPLIIDILGQSMALVNEVGGRLRRPEARCLLADGVKQHEVAALRSVTADR